MTYLLSILAGGLLVLAFSYPFLYFIGWLALVPLLYAIRGVDLKTAFLRGWLFGAVFIAGTTYWLYFPLADFSGFHPPFAVLLLTILFVLLGLIYGLWSLLFRYVNGAGDIHPLIFAFSWVAVEYLRFRIISFFPLGFLGYTQSGFKYIVQLAGAGGIFLVALFVLMINAYLFKLFFRRNYKYLIPLTVIFIFIFIYGGIQLNHYIEKEYETFSLGVVNTAVSQQEKWDSSRIEKNINEFVENARSLNKARLIIGPETSLTFDLVRNEYYREKFITTVEQLNKYLQVGSLAINKDNTGKYNSSFLIAPDGTLVDRYNKRKLVLFGEYIPFNELINGLTGLKLNSLVPGGDEVIFATSFARWGTQICSEILYPLTFSKNSELDYIVNQSNEVWYGDSNLHQQMWSAAVYRAVEYRCSVVRTGNYIYTGLIQPSGLVSAAYRGGKDFTVEVKKNSEETIYRKWGNITGRISVILIMIIFLAKLLIRYRQKNSLS